MLFRPGQTVALYFFRGQHWLYVWLVACFWGRFHVAPPWLLATKRHSLARPGSLALALRPLVTSTITPSNASALRRRAPCLLPTPRYWPAISQPRGNGLSPHC